jgi:hypothetical protein
MKHEPQLNRDPSHTVLAVVVGGGGAPPSPHTVFMMMVNFRVCGEPGLTHKTIHLSPKFLQS